MASRKNSSTHKSTAKKKPAAKTAVKKTPAKSVAKGDKVEWHYGAGKAIGKVLQVFSDKVTKKIKSATITRKATPEKPAVLVKSDKGGSALKSSSEVKKAGAGRGKGA